MRISIRGDFMRICMLILMLVACCAAIASDSAEIENQKEFVVRNGEAGDMTEKRQPLGKNVPRRFNCVDACVLEFLLRSAGISVPDAEFDAGLVELGLEPSAAFRSLADCLDMLAFFGMEVVTLRFTVAKDATFPPIGIVYIPPMQAGKVGHVVVVEDADDDRIVVWNPLHFLTSI